MVMIAYQNNIKYKPVHRSGYLDKLGECLFKHPGTYLSFLACISIFIIIYPPKVIIFETHNQEDVNEVEYYDWNNERTLEALSDREFSSHITSFEASNSASLTQTNYGSPACSGFKDNERFDCFPEVYVTEDTCVARGCCWSPTPKGELKGVPYCYYPSNFKSYEYVNVTEFDVGKIAYLKQVKSSSYPDNINLVKMEINYINENILQIKIYDGEHPRYETPFPKVSRHERCSLNNTAYLVNIDKDHFGFNIVRKSNNQSIFNTQDVGGFIFADQMLQLSARLPSKRLYGLGQRRNNFQLDLDWNRIALFNHDTPPVDKLNLYGSHPFYLTLEDNGLSSGVFLLNSNAMDVILQPTPAITYRVIGGVLDFYVMTGPSPADVISQYTQLIGRPFMPPYWSLGFHLCRYGYNSLGNMVAAWNRTRAAGIPLDTQWNDIDAMDDFKDFTYDKKAFNGLPDFVKTLHKEGMHYVIMTDPGQSAGEPRGTYPPYDEMIQSGVYLKDGKLDKPFVTKVWNPNGTVFPDFFHPDTPTYWERQIKRFHDTIEFDGLWIDMNDPSTVFSGGKDGCEPNKYDSPPYVPAVHGGKLCTNTVCMSARHHTARHYDLHNIFASQEAVLTARALQNVRQKRPFVISRSSFPGHGHFTGVWTGDIYSSWDDMSHSIADILSFSLFGIPMVGADICGFNGNTTVALCQRWSQLGAFYPFSRNHNDASSSDQDPAVLGPAVAEAARKALLTRYSLLPYLYTLFWHAHTRGDTVARPMFVQFPTDDKTYTLYSQFLWGSALLIAPLLSEEKTYAKAYLPAGRWYDFYLYKPISSKGSTYLLPTSSDSIPLMLYGGHIVPTQQPGVTTTASRKNPFGLIVALCPDGNATGDLYWDDGDSLDYKASGNYNYVTLRVSGGRLSSVVMQWAYQTTMRLVEVKVLGVERNVTKVNVDGAPAHFSYSPGVKMLYVINLTINLGKNFSLTWE